MTLSSLAPDGIAVDSNPAILKYNPAPNRVCTLATELPFAADSFATVLAADLVHHLTDDELVAVAAEVRRVLTPGGVWVAWWYAEPPAHAPHAPDAPKHTRSLERALELVAGAQPLELEGPAFASTPTVGFVLR